MDTTAANPPVEAPAGTPSNRKIYTDGLEPVCAPGHDPADLATVRELGIINRQLGADAIAAGQSDGPLRWEALARLGWVLHRRKDPTASVETWLDLELPRLLELLGLADEQEAEAAANAQAAELLEREDPTRPAHEQ